MIYVSSSAIRSAYHQNTVSEAICSLERDQLALLNYAQNIFSWPRVNGPDIWSGRRVSHGGRQITFVAEAAKRVRRSASAEPGPSGLLHLVIGCSARAFSPLRMTTTSCWMFCVGVYCHTGKLVNMNSGWTITSRLGWWESYIDDWSSNG